MDVASGLITTAAFNQNALKYFTSTEINNVANFQYGAATNRLVLGNSRIVENNAVGAVVGTLVTKLSTPSYDGGMTYSLVNGLGDSGNNRFAIVGNKLTALESMDYEAQASYSVRVRVTNAVGDWLEQTFEILVTDVDETPPSVLTTSFQTNELESSTWLVQGADTIRVTFSESVDVASRVNLFELRMAGSDGVISPGDPVLLPRNVTVTGAIATLHFASGLDIGNYRLTLVSGIVDAAGNSLDGDSNGVAGGQWQRDFAVVKNANSPIRIVDGFNESFPSKQAFSGDGRFIVFSSGSINLAGDRNSHSDVFIKDLQTSELRIVSVTKSAVQGNSESKDASISANGRYVVFYSNATNLVPEDRNGSTGDIFIKDLQTGDLRLVSVSSDGVQSANEATGASISDDGRFVTYQGRSGNRTVGDMPGLIDVFVKDMQTGELRVLSMTSGGELANGRSSLPSISGNGRFVTFESTASNLVAVTSGNARSIFVKDLNTGSIRLASSSVDGVSGNYSSTLPSISTDGRYVTFSSEANNLVADDTDVDADVFVKDMETGTVALVSGNSPSAQTSQRLVGAVSLASSISGDGRYIVFESWADDLVAGDDNNAVDVFVKDMQTGLIRAVSMSVFGVQGNSSSLRPSISADGKFISFNSDSSNLVLNGNANIWKTLVTGNPLA